MTIGLLPKLYSPGYTPGRKPVGGQWEIDWQHPLAENLLFFATVQNGKFVNLADKDRQVAQFPTLTADIRADKLVTGSGKTASFDVGSITGQNKLTFATSVNLYNEVNTSCYVFGADDIDWLLAWNNSENRFQANFNGAENWSQTTSTFTLNTTNSVMAVKTGLTFKFDGHWFVNGKKENTYEGDIDDRTTTSDIDTDITIGDRSSGSRWWDGEIEYVAIWSTDLSDELAQSFQKDPYQFLKPKLDPVYFYPDVDGNPIAVNDAYDVTDGILFESTPDSILDNDTYNCA